MLSLAQIESRRIFKMFLEILSCITSISMVCGVAAEG